MTHLPEPPEPLPVATTDSHTHLSSTTEFSGLAVADNLALARAAGVTRVVDVGTDVASSAESVALADRHQEVVACVAIHPNEAARAGDRLGDELAALEALLGTSDRIRGVGETGLDYFRTRDADGQARQKTAFAAHIAWAKAAGLALVVHDRDAHGDILDVLDAEGAPDRVMMHCFSGDADFAAECVKRGFTLSFAGTVTFSNATNLRDAAAITPVDQLLVETDAPYLTPMPFRGRPNGSYLIPLTVRALAAATGAELTELCAAISDNGERVFGPWQ